LKSTETQYAPEARVLKVNFSNFGSLKSTETSAARFTASARMNFSNFGSLKSTETRPGCKIRRNLDRFQQFRLVEEH